MSQSKILIVDSIINFILGFILLFFPQNIIDFLGIPQTDVFFYPSIFGGVLIGIAIALIIEVLRKSNGMVGLGLGGAVSINMCGGLVLAYWLLSHDLGIPRHGVIFLWGLVVVLVVISSVEMLLSIKND